VLNVIQQLVEEGMTMLTVTHEMSFAYQFAHRIIFMDDGRFAEVGPPGQIFDDPQDNRTRQFLSAVGRFENKER
jgi:ABC-type polar amino acid transport system ATPase subunit